MNDTLSALVIKFLMTFIVASVAFIGLDGNPWGWVFGFAILATALNYVVGDLYILPEYGNIYASVGDGVLGLVAAYVVSLVTVFQTTIGSLILFGILVAVGEYFFHKVIVKDEDVSPNTK
ncbi:DUF2512 family protein [Natranaerobius thermophilus]|uniref:DUF2512 family protein n=1 Tax=Natranaerobius thermophilus (strain ATCC BAA-1301 / DSM 18059 / JW/NM-WN-LF) TaxID=457570 RepID=B2A616_NATTJ|nr:DUF2512 family protein [Natranaerobius thermophilus]ACB85433.1 hypothetical protein Nther_1861 [Natranaerobius thermophilus JW/NM-WN-LF]